MTKASAILLALLLSAAWPLSAPAEQGASGTGVTSELPAQDAGTALASTVEQAWSADAAVPAYLLAAKMRAGKLQLFGAVETAKQREAALAAARKLAGDTPVVDHIEITRIESQTGLPAVGSGGPTALPPKEASAALAATVEQAWMADDSVPYDLIAAKQRDGSLQLFGAVETPEQRASAVAIAEKYAGGVRVVDHIALKKIASLQ